MNKKGLTDLFAISRFERVLMYFGLIYKVWKYLRYRHKDSSSTLILKVAGRRGSQIYDSITILVNWKAFLNASSSWIGFWWDDNCAFIKTKWTVVALIAVELMQQIQIFHFYFWLTCKKNINYRVAPIANSGVCFTIGDISQSLLYYRIVLLGDFFRSEKVKYQHQTLFELFTYKS